MDSRILKIENSLHRRENAINQPPIYIRDIVAYPVNNLASPPAGEFYPERVQSSQFNQTKARFESEDELMGRIVSYVGNLAQRAKKIHLKDNFIQDNSTETLSPTMKRDRMNYVTRLSLPEFSLYPHKDRGPLSLDGFSKLVESLEKMARKLPENLHLILSSLPVNMGNQEVQNIAVVVQCGPLPMIHPFTKAIPSRIDPIYANTENPTFSDRIPSYTSFNQLGEKEKKLISNLAVFCIDKQEIDQFNRLLKELANSSFIIDKLNELVKKIENNVYKSSNEKTFIKDFNQFSADLNAFITNSNSVNQIQNEIKQLSTAAFVGKSPFALYYGNNIICKTAGGAQFRLAGDICLDLYYGVAKTQVANDIKLTRNNGGSLIPTRATQFITSNSINVLSEEIFSKTLVHADPIESARMKSVMQMDRYLPVESTKEITKPDFGSKTNIDTYPIRMMENHSKAAHKAIIKHNQFTIKLNALRHERNHRLGKNEAINQKIINLIVTPVLNLLQNSSNDWQTLEQQIQSCFEPTEAIGLLKEVETGLKKDQKLSELKSAIARAQALLKKEQNTLLALKHEHLKHKERELATRNRAIEKVSLSTPSFTFPKISHCLVGQNNLFAHHANSFLNATPNPEKTHTKTSQENPFPPESIFFKPLSFAENLIVFKFLAHYSPFTLPWNKVSRLTADDKKLLNERLSQLNLLTTEFELKKQKRAYRFGIHHDLYEDVETLLGKTKSSIEKLLRHGSKTSILLSSIHNNIDRIQTLIPRLTNKFIEKELRHAEIRLARQQRK